MADLSLILISSENFGEFYSGLKLDTGWMVEEIRDFEWLTLCLFNYLIYNLYLKENPGDF